MDEFDFYNKHYITVDGQGRVVDGWSDGPHPEKDVAGAICINEKGGYQFRLHDGGEENPALWTMDGIPLYKWDGEVQTRSEEEIEAERAAIVQAQATEQAKVYAIKARRAAMEEAQAALITAQIDTLAVDDATALRWKALYPEWSAEGVAYEAGMKRQRLDRLYRCRQDHTSQAGWAPELAPALWEEISESHAGTEDDPIPYNGNMALESGRYYSQDGVTYRCTRDTEIPVYNALRDLVGLYVEAARDGQRT